MMFPIGTYKMNPEEAKAKMANSGPLPQKYCSVLSQRAMSQEQCDKLDRDIEKLKTYLDILINELDPDNKDDYLRFNMIRFDTKSEMYSRYLQCSKEILHNFNMLLSDELTSVLLKLCNHNSAEKILNASAKALQQTQ